MRNWDINECIILEMWDEQNDPKMQEQEDRFQRMLVNNMESVFKIFFRGMSTILVKKGMSDQNGPGNMDLDLRSLEKRKLVQSRVRPDTKVKQYHAG